jgi:hypothetical protein
MWIVANEGLNNTPSILTMLNDAENIQEALHELGGKIRLIMEQEEEDINLIKFETWDQDINELKISMFGDNLCQVVHTDLSSICCGEECIITLIYDKTDCYKFKGVKTQSGVLIQEEKYFSFIEWEE